MPVLIPFRPSLLSRERLAAQRLQPRAWLLLGLVVLLALGMVASVATAQRNWATGDWGGGAPGWFDAQAEGNYGTLGRLFADVTVTIPYRNLIFLRESNGSFRAGYRIRVVQSDDHGHEVRFKEYDGEVIVAEYDSTRDTILLKRRVQFPLLISPTPETSKEKRPRRIRLTVRAELDHSQRWGKRELSIGFPHISRAKVALGDVIVYRARCPVQDQSDRDLLIRLDGGVDESRFVRVASSIFDLSSGPPYLLVKVYDLRGLSAADSLEVKVEAFAGDDKEAEWRSKIGFPGGQKVSEALLRVPPSALQKGRNRLLFRLNDDDEREVELRNFGLDPTSERQWKDNLEVIEDMASKEEMKTLRDASPSQRAALWMEFWQRRDPDPETPDNSRLQEHVRRVAYAREHYADGGRDGALSDRGRVYVQMGPPDSIESQTMLQNSSAEYELWHYLNEGVVYYFRDDDGLGHWRLVWRQEG